MNKVISTSVISLAALSLGGCATLLNGTHQDLSFLTEPAGAGVVLSSGQSCTSPCEFSLKRGNDLQVDFTMDGYEPAMVYVQSRLGGSTFGNIIAGGGIGAVVDGSNGASNRLYPNPVSVRLAPLGSGAEAVLLDEDGEVIATVAEHNAEVGEDVRDGLVGQGLAPRTDGGTE